MNSYRYTGPVVLSGKCIQNNWIAETAAESEKKAKSNLAYRFKIETGKPAFAKVSLPGKIEII